MNPVMWRSRRSILALMLTANLAAAFPALAGGGGGGGGAGDGGASGAPASAGPGQTVSVPANRGGYTRIEITNTGNTAAEVQIDGGGYQQTISVQPGETVAITEMFDVPQVRIVNKSAAATLSIKSKWL